MIFPAFVPFFEEIFALDGFLGGPALVFGVQEINLSAAPPSPRDRLKSLALRLASPGFSLRPAPSRPPVPADYARCPDLAALLKARGLADTKTLDFFDPRADLRYDMNLPAPDSERARYHALFDVGCLEHVFDTRQCLENCVRMVRPGGFYFLHTPVTGFFKHGLHTFNPEGLLSAFELNGFEIVYQRYSTSAGAPLPRPVPYDDTLIWLVGKKTKPSESFKIPQQGTWKEAY